MSAKRAKVANEGKDYVKRVFPDLLKKLKESAKNNATSYIFEVDTLFCDGLDCTIDMCIKNTVFVGFENRVKIGVNHSFCFFGWWSDFIDV